MADELERLNRVLDDLAAERDPRDRPLLWPDEAELAEMAALLKAARDEPAPPDAAFVEALAGRLALGEWRTAQGLMRDDRYMMGWK